MEIQKPENTHLEHLVKNMDGTVTDPNQCLICKRILSCKSALMVRIGVSVYMYKIRSVTERLRFLFKREKTRNFLESGYILMTYIKMADEPRLGQHILSHHT